MDMQNATESSAVKRNVTQRAAMLMVANIAAAVLSFAFPLVLVRIMSRAEYGLYRQSFAIMVSALGLLNLQVAVSVFYYMAKEPAKKLQVAHNVIIFYTLVGAFVFLLFMIWPGWVTIIFQGSELVGYVPMIGLAIFCWLVSTNLEAVPIALGDVSVASGLIILSQLTKAVIMICAALIVGTLTAILVGAIIQGILQTAFMVFYLRRRFGHFRVPFDWPLFKAQIGNALPFGVGGIIAIVQNDMHNYFVSHHFEPSIFAIYAVGCFQLPLLGMITSSFANAFNPEMAKHNERREFGAIVDLWMDVIGRLAFFFFPAFMLMFVLRSELITTLFTKNYLASVPIFAVNLLSILLGMALHMHLLRLFDQLRYFRLKLYLVLVPITYAALKIGLNIGGLTGVAIAVVSMQAIDVTATVLVVSRQLGITRAQLRRLSPLLRTAAATLTAAAATLGTRLALDGHTDLSKLVIGSIVFGVVYLISAVIFGSVTEDDRQMVWQLLSKICRRDVDAIAVSQVGEN